VAEYADLERIARRVAGHVPRLSAPGSYDLEAAVAVCLRPGPRSVEALFIRRSEHPDDPWSGDVAFPGGRRDGGDASLWETAMRETMEETGVDLRAEGKLLGRLDDVHPRVVVLPNLNIAPFVAEVPAGALASARSEIVAVSWVPLADLADPALADRRVMTSARGVREFPSIRWEDLEIWGLTHRILTQLLDLLGK
jgi:8-oxo-dGTP pyrophosphatase MutT (NUDIX family)